MILRMTGSEFNVNEEFVRSITTTNLSKRKNYMKFVPHNVHDDEKLRTNACKDFVETADDEPGFLNTIIIGCESLHFQYDHEIQR
jgi:hypothetical protein